MKWVCFKVWRPKRVQILGAPHQMFWQTIPEVCQRTPEKDFNLSAVFKQSNSFIISKFQNIFFSEFIQRNMNTAEIYGKFTKVLRRKYKKIWKEGKFMEKMQKIWIQRKFMEKIRKLYGEFLKVLRRKYKKMNTGKIYGENTKNLRRIFESFTEKIKKNE